MANTALKEYKIKGFVVDDERLKNPDGRPDYFEELLEHIRDIPASENAFTKRSANSFHSAANMTHLCNTKKYPREESSRGLEE